MGCPDPFKVDEEIVLLRAARRLLLDVVPGQALALSTPGAVQLRCRLGPRAEEVGLERHSTDPRRGINPARLKASRPDLQAPLVEHEMHTLCFRLDLEIRQQHSIRDACEAIPGPTGRSTGGRAFDAEDHFFTVEADLQFLGLI